MKRKIFQGVVLAAAVAVGGVAAADTNVVTKVQTGQVGAKTIVTVHGTATPSFTAYRLERPSRVVVDLADGRMQGVDGPIDVDSWAVGQIAVAQYQDDHTRTARVMIGFRRSSTYDVRADGHDVIITITPDEAPPVAAPAFVGPSREEVLAAQHELTAAQEQLDETTSAAAVANRKIADANRQIKAEQQKLADLQHAQASTQQQSEAAARQMADADRQIKAEQQKLADLQRAQASTQQQSEAAALKLAQEQKDQQQKLAELTRARAAEEARLTQLRNARAVEERSADKQRAAVLAERQAIERAERAKEASALAALAAADAQKELTRVADARRAEEARLADLRQLESATTAEGRAQLAQLKREQAARTAEVERLKKQAEQLAVESQQQYRDRLAETQKLVEAQRLVDHEAAQREAKLAADRKAHDARGAAQQAALAAAAGQLQKQTADATRLRQEAAHLRDDAARRVAAADHNSALANDQANARARQIENEAAANAEKLATQAADAARRESDKLTALRREAANVAQAADAARADLAAARAEREQLVVAQQKVRAQAATDQAEAARLANVRQLEAERAAHAAALASTSTVNMQKAERDAQRVAEQRLAESARLEAIQKETARAAQQQRVESARLQAVLDSAAQKTAAQEKELAVLTSARAKEEAALASTQSEHRQLMDQVASAKAELERVQRDLKTRLAVVPTPAHAAVAAVAPPAPAPAAVAAAPVLATHIDDVQVSGSQVRVLLSGATDVEHTVLRMDEHTSLLRLSKADLPARLERTLDASQLDGTIDRVSSYRDRRDPGAVRVEVHFRDAAIEPHLTAHAGTLAWEFTRPAIAANSVGKSGLTSSWPASQIYAPQRVGAFGPPVPLDAGPAPVSLTQNGANASRHRKVYTGRRIDLDFKDVDIHNLMRLLSDIGQVNVVMSDDVKGTITVRMRDVPWDQALDVILKSKNLGMTREGNLIRVAPADKLEKEVEQEIARSKAQIELKPIDTRLIYLSYAEAKDILPRVQDVMSPRGKVSFDARTNTLIVSDVGANIALAEDLVRNLDTQTPQIQIEARIVESTTNFSRDIGIQWGGSGIASSSTGNPTGIVFPSTVGVAGGAVDQATNVQGLLNNQAVSPNYVVNLPAAVGTGAGGALGVTLGSVSGNVNINLRLSALENTGNVRIVSAPKIMALDNVEAAIEQGTSIPISVVSAAGTNTVFIDAKLNLTVKPHVTNEGSVIMNVAITRNEPDFVNTGARGDPTILKKQAHTQMLVRDGDTAVIGGIYTRNTGLQFTKVPYLAEIPILGWLFKNRNENDDRTELLIFLTPRIINRSPTTARR